AALREHTAHWPPGERLLAFAAAGNPEGVLREAEAVLAVGVPPAALRSFMHAQVVRVRALPALPSPLVARADSLAAKIPEAVPTAKIAADAAQAWHPRLKKCWSLFDE